MKNRYSLHKWTTLITFSLMYNMVYIGRFNINNNISEFAGILSLSAGQQNIIVISLFFSYAIGSFINGYFADRYGGKHIAVTGAVMTCFINICIPDIKNWILVLTMWIFNGYFQSMIWLGSVFLLAQWWENGNRGKSIGIANFSSGLSHATAYILPAALASVFPALTWKQSFVTPLYILIIFVMIFSILASASPSARGLADYSASPGDRKREAELLSLYKLRKYPWKLFLGNRKFIIWCFIALLSSICRYGLLNWIPLYYENFAYGPVISDFFLSLTLPVGMAFGTLIMTWFTDARFSENKGIMITALAAMCGTMVTVFPMLDSPRAILIGIFLTGFFLYGINGIFWLYAIDYGSRYFAGSTAGILNGFAYFGAGIESLIFAGVLKLFGSYQSVFILMEILCICMALFGIFVAGKDTKIIPELGIKD